MSQKNPEDHVLDAIDALVNEQLAVGPVDDYNVNRYPKCSDCGHQWHGEKCHWCSCEQSTGEREVQYDEALDCWRVPPRLGTELSYSGHGRRREDPRRHLDFHVCISECDHEGRREHVRQCQLCGQPADGHGHGGGYTRVDLERLRSHSWVQPNYLQRYVIGQAVRPRVRFWEYNLERNLYRMIEGTAEVMQIDWSHNGCTMVVRLDPFTEYIVLADDPHPENHPTPPTVPVGMITFEGAAFEGAEDEGFHLVGHLHPDDLQFNQTVEYAFGGGVVRLQEQVTVQIRDALPPPSGP